MKIGLREANHRFSRAMKAVRAGKEVLMERGRQIAVIKPLKDDDSFKASMQTTVDEGFLNSQLSQCPRRALRYAQSSPADEPNARRRLNSRAR